MIQIELSPVRLHCTVPCLDDISCLVFRPRLDDSTSWARPDSIAGISPPVKLLPTHRPHIRAIVLETVDSFGDSDLDRFGSRQRAQWQLD